MRGAKLYFKLLGTLKPADVSNKTWLFYPEDWCPETIVTGCVTVEKFRAFLTRKWIPGRATIPQSTIILTRAKSFFRFPGVSRIQGHYFRFSSAHAMVEDFITYILTRPRDAVPPPVRKLLLPDGSDHNHHWPGGIGAQRERYYPPGMAPPRDFNESDVAVFSGVYCSKSCFVAAVMEAYPEAIDANRGVEFFPQHQISLTEERMRQPVTTTYSMILRLLINSTTLYIVIILSSIGFLSVIARQTYDMYLRQVAMREVDSQCAEGVERRRMKIFSLMSVAERTKNVQKLDLGDAEAPWTRRVWADKRDLSNDRVKQERAVLDARWSMKLTTSVRDSPTPSTPPVAAPAAPLDADTPGIKAARTLYEDNIVKVDAIYSSGRHRAWAKAVRELALGGKDVRFTAEGADVEKLAKIVIILKNDFSCVGLDLAAPLNSTTPPKASSRKSTSCCTTPARTLWPRSADSAAYDYLLGTDSESDRDGRRALLHLVKGCVPPGVRQTLQEEHSQLRYPPARVDPRPLIAKEQRLVRDNRSEDWTPTEATRMAKIMERIDSTLYAAVGFGRREMRALPLCNMCGQEGVDKKYHEYFGGKGASGGTAAFCMPADGEDGVEVMHTLALCHILQTAADDGADAFAEAVQFYSAPAVIADDQGIGGIDVSAYGFSVGGASGGVLDELHGLVNQVKAMEEKVGVSFTHTSLVVEEEDDVHAHDMPTSPFCGGAALSAAVPQQLVSGAAGGVASAVQVAHGGTGHAAGLDHEIFSLGVRHRRADPGPQGNTWHVFIRILRSLQVEWSFCLPVSGEFAQPFSAGVLSIETELDKLACGDRCGHRSGDRARGHVCGRTGLRSTPPWGLRPHFIMRTCLISLFCFGIVGAAAGYGGATIYNDNINSVTTESPLMCIGQACLYQGFDSLSPVVQEQLMQVYSSAVAAGLQGGPVHGSTLTTAGTSMGFTCSAVVKFTFRFSKLALFCTQSVCCSSLSVFYGLM
ncbi:hypothetical protein CYMTET_51868 [Cymbomonas tetramitiformis]|uniref:Uncharacterized protein n=1 Tax=Cymbomonas tetramitiformis TaxID=36881 RepID=A0AAE0BKD7_9CHLO|nr:hypothetical protein CYMTET_51868 [Cymbomonas tetramitiformis]